MRLFRLIILSLLLTNPLVLFASALTESELKRFNLILAQQDHVQGKFEQIKNLSILPMPILSSGTFIFDKKLGLDWTILKPVHSQMILDEKGIRQIQNGKVVWTLDSAQPAASHISTIIASVLAADWVNLNQHFNLSVKEDEEQWIINLLPKSQVLLSAISRIEMSGEDQLTKMKLFEANGDSTVIVFNILRDL